jgi:hypothetical protein
MGEFIKMLFFQNKYLIIPADEGFNDSDRFLLEAMNAVAKANGFKNGKKYLKSKLGCSGNSVKNMTKDKISTKTWYWNLQEYPTKDGYQHIRKIDKDKYAEVIESIIIEYSKIATEEKRKKLIEFLRRYNEIPFTYQKALCYKTLDGLRVVIFDAKTANRVNRIKNADTVSKDIQNKLLMNETEVNL